MDKIGITIVGAGVVGLAIGLELSKVCKDIFIIEQENSFGQGISSRNSEVIHSGIYYPKDSLKTHTCIEGRELLYCFCSANRITHNKIGKLIVAINDEEVKDLRNLFQNGLENGIDDLRLLSKNEIEKLEPNIKAREAIFSPSTGIVDSHSLMKNMASQFQVNSGAIVYNTEVVEINRSDSGFKITVEDKNEGRFEFSSSIFINSAGLNSGRIAKLVGLAKDEYKLKYCKGDYMRVHSNKAGLIKRLIYPIPKKTGAGLGIHATLDLAGSLRLGPDDEYVEKIDYNINPAKADIFYKDIKSFLPFITLEDITPDMAGIRPKLQGPGEGFRDFVIKDESSNNLTGFINLIGIESPGLTSALSIARVVRGIAKGLF